MSKKKKEVDRLNKEEEKILREKRRIEMEKEKALKIQNKISLLEKNTMENNLSKTKKDWNDKYDRTASTGTQTRRIRIIYNLWMNDYLYLKVL